jgi:hypothetical protein
MSTKTLIWVGLTIGSTIGSYLPTLFGNDIFSVWSIIWSGIGGIAGVWAGYTLGQKFFFD